MCFFYLHYNYFIIVNLLLWFYLISINFFLVTMTPKRRAAINLSWFFICLCFSKSLLIKYLFFHVKKSRILIFQPPPTPPPPKKKKFFVVNSKVNINFQGQNVVNFLLYLCYDYFLFPYKAFWFKEIQNSNFSTSTPPPPPKKKKSLLHMQSFTQNTDINFQGQNFAKKYLYTIFL